MESQEDNGSISMKKSKPVDMTIKLITIGNSSVGKTCLILRYYDEVFSEDPTMTMGVNTKVKRITRSDGKEIRL